MGQEIEKPSPSSNYLKKALLTLVQICPKLVSIRDTLLTQSLSVDFIAVSKL
jgi:hypothetical protein